MTGFAQNAAEEVTVTGSRIKRPNLESANPVTVVDVAEIKYQGTTRIETALNRLPQFTADSNDNGSNGSDGTARVNLGDPGSNRMLERVDVVIGGATAVCGSDAVAGVVIDDDGFGSVAFHSWPDAMRFDAYSGDDGMGFFGHATATACTGDGVHIEPRDSGRSRLYVAPAKLWITLAAGKGAA
jgi:hypothetical protein